nr:cyclin-dependent kinase inhibitor 3-like [Ipomoea trifida]
MDDAIMRFTCPSCRTTRESTPISLIRDPDAIPTPGSSTRRTSTNQAHRRVQNSPEGHIPTIHEMNEFFSGAEEQQQREFIEKYNYDPVNDRPLPGRGGLGEVGKLQLLPKMAVSGGVPLLVWWPGLGTITAKQGKTFRRVNGYYDNQDKF